MEQPQKLFAEYMRKISQLYQDFEAELISREEAMARLSVLKAEHKQLVDSGIFPLNKRIAIPVERGDDMIRRFSRSRRTYHTEHELDFKCQCKSCVSKHTITMADRDFLRDLKISWGKTAAEENAEADSTTNI
jgi:hypothetical protein